MRRHKHHRCQHRHCASFQRVAPELIVRAPRPTVAREALNPAQSLLIRTRIDVTRVAPPPPAFSFFDRSATGQPVVSIRLATLAAFWSAARTTWTGSMTPCSQQVAVLVARGVVGEVVLGLWDLVGHVEPSSPAFCAICRSGSSRALRMVCVSDRCSSAVAGDPPAKERHVAGDALRHRRTRRVQRVFDVRRGPPLHSAILDALTRSR
jgi:hypothetical protein